MLRGIFKHIIIIISVLITATTFGIKTEVSSDKKQEASSDKKQKEALFLGEKAYIYGYPLILMELTKRILTNVSSASENAAPVNQFMHKTRFLDANSGIVKPNADTLYSSAFLDLSKEPIILHIPEIEDRYYIMPIFDAWTNVFSSISIRTASSKKEANFAITGPNWQGELPSGLKEIKSPTNTAWIIGRTETKGPNDYRIVHYIQKKYTLIPLSSFKKPYQPPIHVPNSKVDMKTSPAIQVEEMDVRTFFSKLSELMKKNPPPEADQSLVKKFSKIGITPGKKFNDKLLSKNTYKALEKGADSALKKIKEPPIGHKIVNGWKIMTSGIGKYGTDYLQRARMAYHELGSNLPQDAIYPTTEVDSTGRLLHGKNQYVLHFEKEQLPPVKGFWTLTLYNPRQHFSANPINRYVLGSRNPLKFNNDGSLDIYIQRLSPGPDKEPNWLPAPMGKFSLMMRLYWPKSDAINDRWAPPAVKKN